MVVEQVEDLGVPKKSEKGKVWGYEKMDWQKKCNLMWNYKLSKCTWNKQHICSKCTRRRSNRGKWKMENDKLIA